MPYRRKLLLKLINIKYHYNVICQSSCWSRNIGRRNVWWRATNRWDIFGTWRELTALSRGSFQFGGGLAHPDQDIVGYDFL